MASQSFGHRWVGVVSGAAEPIAPTLTQVAERGKARPLTSEQRKAARKAAQARTVLPSPVAVALSAASRVPDIADVRGTRKEINHLNALVRTLTAGLSAVGQPPWVLTANSHRELLTRALRDAVAANERAQRLGAQRGLSVRRGR